MTKHFKLDKKLAYKTILYKSESPHTSALTILEEVINNYQIEILNSIDNNESKILFSPLEKIGWRVSYKYFEEKFGFKHAKVRKALLKLESMELLKRVCFPSALNLVLDLKRIKIFLII